MSPPSQNKNILVTGASGFLGRPLCAALKQSGYHVTALNRRLQSGPWDQQHAFDLRSPAIEPEVLADIDAAIHLGGIAHDTGFNQDEYTEVNVRGSLSLALMAIGANINRFIFVSSARVTSIIERKGGADHYAHSKYDAELGLRNISAGQNLNLTIVRPSLVYGHGVKGNLAQILVAIQKGWFPPLPDSEGGISMISVEDVISAVIRMLQNDNTIGKTYELHDGEIYNPRRIYTEARCQMERPVPSWTVPLSWLRAAAKIGDLAKKGGIRLPLSTPVIEKLFANTALHSTALMDDTGWRPTKTLKDLLPDML